jgi:hypothetical protein
MNSGCPEPVDSSTSLTVDPELAEGSRGRLTIDDYDIGIALRDYPDATVH